MRLDHNRGLYILYDACIIAVVIMLSYLRFTKVLVSESQTSFNNIIYTLQSILYIISLI